jgi:hypothetical protein
LKTVKEVVSLCEKYYCAVHHRTGNVSKYLAFPMRCKTWDCPVCRPIKALNYKERMKKLKCLQNLNFYTLTFFHSAPPAEVWENASKCWNRLRTNLRNRFGPFNYVRILETHKNSPYPHFHFVADYRFPPTALGTAAVAAGFGYQIDSQAIDSDRALDYVLKYLTKEWPRDDSKEYRKQYKCRIISFSRGLLSPSRRVTNWELLCYNSSLGACLDHINVDYTWRTDEKPLSICESGDDLHHEVHIVWTNRVAKQPEIKSLGIGRLTLIPLDFESGGNGA